MNESIKALGSKIKMLFDRKQLEDAQALDQVNGNLIDIEEAVREAREAIQSKNNDDMIRAIETLTKAFNAKNLSVKVEAPIVNVPEPKIEIIKDSKETEGILKKLLFATLKQGENQGAVKITNWGPDEAVPVRLTDKSGKKFYDAMFQALSSGAGYPFRLPSGESARANLDSSGNLVVSVTIDSVDVSNFPIEYPLPDSQIATLTPPAAITGFSTESKQDTIISSLSTLNSKDFATQTTLASILAKLISSPSTEAKQDSTITAINSDPVLNANAPDGTTVGLTSGSVLASNSSRKGLILGNCSTNTISLGFGAAASLFSGITLLPGGVYSMGRFDKTTAEVFAISDGEDANLSIQEYQ